MMSIRHLFQHGLKVRIYFNNLAAEILICSTPQYKIVLFSERVRNGFRRLGNFLLIEALTRKL